jgi:hypothetical protein
VQPPPRRAEQNDSNFRCCLIDPLIKSKRIPPQLRAVITHHHHKSYPKLYESLRSALHDDHQMIDRPIVIQSGACSCLATDVMGEKS